MTSKRICARTHTHTRTHTRTRIRTLTCTLTLTHTSMYFAHMHKRTHNGGCVCVFEINSIIQKTEPFRKYRDSLDARCCNRDYSLTVCHTIRTRSSCSSSENREHALCVFREQSNQRTSAQHVPQHMHLNACTASPPHLQQPDPVSYNRIRTSIIIRDTEPDVQRRLRCNTRRCSLCAVLAHVLCPIHSWSSPFMCTLFDFLFMLPM